MVWRWVSTATAVRLGLEGLLWIFYDRPHYSFLASLWASYTKRTRKVWQLPKPFHSPSSCNYNQILKLYRRHLLKPTELFGCYAPRPDLKTRSKSVVTEGAQWSRVRGSSVCERDWGKQSSVCILRPLQSRATVIISCMKVLTALMNEWIFPCQMIWYVYADTHSTFGHIKKKHSLTLHLMSMQMYGYIWGGWYIQIHSCISCTRDLDL